MKLNKTKKNKKEFDPVHHWYILLYIIFFMSIVIVIYASYNFFYIKNEIALIEIESKNSIQNSTSTDFLEKSRNNNKFLRDINNLNKTLDEYERKELDYNKLINSAIKSTINISTTTASTTVATSTQ